jgi:hypothetical protein
MIKERAMELVAALRSGKYTQTHCQLRLGDSHCCLGVACDISGLGEWDLTDIGYPKYLGDDVELPMEVKEYFGFASSKGYWSQNLPSILIDPVCGIYAHDLAKLNDNGWTFAEIANFIEQHWEAL